MATSKWIVKSNQEILYDEPDYVIYENEIAVVREDNEFGFQSCGWSGSDKIILFEELDNPYFHSKKEAQKFANWMNEVAKTIADALNAKNL